MSKHFFTAHSSKDKAKNIEDEIVRKELLPLMESFYKDELMYFTSDEFENIMLENILLVILKKWLLIISSENFLL